MDPAPARGSTSLFLAGDVMLGRGVDQVLRHACPPRLYEPWVESALQYVEMAERAHGPIPAPVGFDWVWGELLGVLRRRDPDARIVNLETALTTSEEAAPKGIHYRMHPGNVPVLTEAGIDVCVLANNHVLDWGLAGLLETLGALEGEGLVVAGAGRDADAASEPAVVSVGGRGPGLDDGGERGAPPPAEGRRDAGGADGPDVVSPDAGGHVGTSGASAGGAGRNADATRLLVVGVGGPDCGIPREWAAGPRRPGVRFVRDYSGASAEAVARSVERVRRPGDLVVVSIHWGPNWGYDVPRKHRRFAHGLIEEAGVHLVHGHSSHHPMAAEVHEDHLILYGCGDLITDYEGISGYDEYRGDLGLAYFPTLDARDGRLLGLELEPFQMRKFRLRRPSDADRAWLRERLRREYGRFGLDVEEGKDTAFRVGRG